MNPELPNGPPEIRQRKPRQRVPTSWGHFGMFGFDPADRAFVDDATGDLLDEAV